MDESRMHIALRDGTYDLAILHGVAGGEYGPLDFNGKTVLDIGAHIGVFSVLAARGGAARVLAFEAGLENYGLLLRNCEPYPAIECRYAAVWRSDRAEPVRAWRAAGAAGNTGGGTVLDCVRVAGEPVPAVPGTHVPAVALDDVLARVGRVHLLKIDAEGSEYPVLLTSRRLAQVDAIVGEYHRLDGAESEAGAAWTLEALAAHLRAQGFEVRHEDKPDNGRFAARRTAA